MARKLKVPIDQVRAARLELQALESAGLCPDPMLRKLANARILFPRDTDSAVDIVDATWAGRTPPAAPGPGGTTSVTTGKRIGRGSGAAPRSAGRSAPITPASEAAPLPKPKTGPGSRAFPTGSTQEGRS